MVEYMVMKRQTVRKKDILLGLSIGLSIGIFALAGILLLARPWRLAAPVAQIPSPTITPAPSVTATSVPSASPKPSPFPTATVELPGVITYTVQEGDTLWGIAYRFGITTDALKAANEDKIGEGDVIYPDSVLIIPSIETLPALPTSTPPSEGEAIVHIVQAGEVLSTIAEQYGVTVEEIEAANGLTSDEIWVGQALVIPTSGTPTAVAWYPSILEGDLDSAYPGVLETSRFTLHYTPDTYPAQNPQAVADMVMRGLNHIETVLNAHLEGDFDVYVAGTLFAPPDQALRGRSFSAARRYFFLHDGTGNPADQQYIATHELTHLFTWNTFGRPVSAMLSEGVAVYTGMTLIADSDHMPIDVFCAAYHQAGRLPRVSTSLSFQGHIRDLENYYTAGCFVQYLIETYGPEKFGQLYPTGDYVSVYGRPLVELEAEWIADLEAEDPSVPFDPADLIEAVESVSSAYDELFAGFTGTSAQMTAYHELDAARIALLEGRFDDVSKYLTAFRQQVGQ